LGSIFIGFPYNVLEKVVIKILPKKIHCFSYRWQGCCRTHRFNKWIPLRGKEALAVVVEGGRTG